MTESRTRGRGFVGRFLGSWQLAITLELEALR